MRPLVPSWAVEPSDLVAADGTKIYTFHAEENRDVVALETIPLHVRNAVIAIEDERYYRHQGVDARAILRALRTNTQAGAIEEGGYTITQKHVQKVVTQAERPTHERTPEDASQTGK